MASSYSILHNYNNVPLYTPDFNFIGQAMSYKQQAYDANKAKIESLKASIPSLDVYRDVDKEYVEARLNAVTEINNKYANQDLSDPGLANGLMENLNQVIDSNVKNAIYSTKVFRAEQAEWDKQKEEHPEKYNENNRAYQLRNSEAWRNGTKVGETYQGGGGFKEYSDYQAKITKDLPAIAEKMGWTYEQVEGGDGIFRYKNTYETVDRGQVQAALEGMLNSKDRDQMRIDAWASNKDRPVEDIATDFNNYRQNNLDNAQDNLDNFTKQFDIETDPEKKEILRQLRDQAQSQVTDWTNNTAESVIGNFGVEAAYTTLFTKQIKDNYLNAYSYAPRLIKMDIDQMSVEQQNLRSKQIDQSLAEKRFALQVQAQDFQVQKYNEEKQAKKGTSLVPLLDGSVPKDYDPDRASHIKAQQELEGNAINGVKDLLKNKFGDLTDSQVLQLSGQLGSLAGKKSVTLKIDGETINIDLTNDKNLQALINFKEYALDDSPSKKQEQDSVWKMTMTIKNNLSKVARGENPDIDLSKMPNYGTRLVAAEKDEDGNILSFKVVPTNYKGNSYYGYLLMKKNRTKEDEATLNMYTSLHLIGDPSLSEEQKKSAYNALNRKVLSRVESSDRSKLPTDWKQASGASSNVGGGKLVLIRDLKTNGDRDWLTQNSAYAEELGFAKEYKQLVKLNQELKTATGADLTRVKQQIYAIESNVKKEAEFSSKNPKDPNSYFKVGNSDYHLSDFSANDLEWSGGSIGTGFDTYIPNTFENIYASREQQLETQNMNMNLRSQIFTPDNAQYVNLAYTLKLPQGAKVPISLTRRLDDKGNPTGQVDFSYVGGTSAKPVTINSKTDNLVPLSEEQATSLGIAYASAGRPRYNASYGENAPKIKLGTGKVDEYAEKVARNLSPDLPLDNADKYIEEAQKYGAQKPIVQALDNFDNGVYQFELKPINGVWHNVITENGKQVYAESTEQTEYTEGEIRDLYKTAYLFNQVTMNNYLATLLSDSVKEAKRAAARQ